MYSVNASTLALVVNGCGSGGSGSAVQQPPPPPPPVITPSGTYTDGCAVRDTCWFDEELPAFGDFTDAGCEVVLKLSSAGQSLAIADAVDHVGAVVADEQRSIRGDRDSNGAAVHPETAGIGHETREERHRIHGGFSILESYEDNLITDPRSAIPRTVFSDKSAVAIGFRELLAGIKRELKRRDMSS
jgi:hypothetical protein